MREAKFPPSIYITLERDGNEYFLLPHEDLDAIGNGTEVMIYRRHHEDPIGIVKVTRDLIPKPKK